ncbi:MAG: protein-(glutamine-N5) methyltransferase, release factor-specific [Actinobacteria bacterium]|nr:protein-(glutamine-N5) methyltransferase, release factor-specific [Actinomycetota bacterium]
MPATVGELLDGAEAQIKASEAIELWRPYMARLEAASLLGFVIGHDPEDAGEVVPAAAHRRFDALIARRITGEPAALIIGTTNFRGLELRTRAGVFIPRSSSESLAGEAVRRLRRRKRPVAVDVATGSGPVALAVGSEVPAARVFGVDISPPALSLARANAKRLHIPNVTFLRSDVLSALPKDLAHGVDVFTVHPPYVARSMMSDLPAEIREFEPETSLTDQSEDGLGLVRALVDQAPRWIRTGGWMLVEVSPDLSRRVGALLRRNGYRDVKSHKDSLGATRVIAGRR